MSLRNFDLDAAIDDWTEYCLRNDPSLAIFLVLNAAVFLVKVSFCAHSDPALSDLPTFLYPLFGDSPIALVLMTLSVATLLLNLDRRVADTSVNRPLTYLHTLVFVWLVKYGVWMVVTLSLRSNLCVDFSGAALWDYWGIMFTHAGFLALTLVVPQYGATTKGALEFTLTLTLVSDVFDYGLGYHPPLKYEAGALLTGITVALSFLAVLLASRAFDRLPDVAETACRHPASHSR